MRHPVPNQIAARVAPRITPAPRGTPASTSPAKTPRQSDAVSYPSVFAVPGVLRQYSQD